MKNATENDCSDLFDPIEHAFISDWLGIERPECARGIDLEELFDVDESDGVLKPKSAEYATLEDSISNAVARLVLSGIQKRLPQWTAVYADGHIDFGRIHGEARKPRISLMPQSLFTINWADSGPGYSWPEAYYATYLPVYDVYIVTMSQDSTDVYGYEDKAIGTFNPDVSIIDGSHKVITDWWEGMSGGYGQDRWEYLFDTGLVDTGMAESWADEIWEPEAKEED